jgi:hypothetical protein
MKQWVRAVWADVPARVALVVSLLMRIPAWFLWPGRPLMEAIDALVIAAFLVTLMVRGLLGTDSRVTRSGAALAVVGLLLEAGFYVATGDRPYGVALIFPAGLLLLIGAGLAEGKAHTGRRAPLDER